MPPIDDIDEQTRNEENTEVMITSTDITPLIERSVLRVREDMQDNPYIQEALKVLPVGEGTGVQLEHFGMLL